MLRLLRIRNFAIIDELELEFEAGFNAITGETGAGKSIILDAIGLILGNRANADVIRAGSDEATVEALFDIDVNEGLTNKIEELGIQCDLGAGDVIVKRTIHRNGKNRIYFNGELVTLNQLATLCEDLVDLCSQHEHQSLAKSAFQLDLLDRYGGLLGKRREVRELFAAVRTFEHELTELSGNDQQRARTEDFLRFQLNELDEFDPKEGEEELLISERKRLLNSTHLVEAASQGAKWLGGGDSSDGEDARTLIARASQKISKALAIDEALKPAAEALERASLELEEAVSLLDSYASALEVDPSRLEEVEERLARWNDLKKKYGSTYEEVLKTRNKIAAELDDYANRQERMSQIKERLAKASDAYLKTARDLSKKRKNVAKTLKDSIEKELRELMMPGTSFDIEIADLSTDGIGSAEGIDRIQFLFSPNPGEGLKPVGKIASGGELSRVMLAIRRTIADRGGIGVYLFDEIDSGIGGQTASIVGKKLQSVSKYNQVICITHLPQVAAYANSHYSVSKKISSGRTVSQITRLEGPKRVDELARMLGGLNITEKSRAHAKDLIKQATV